MIIGLGIDIIGIERVRAAIERHPRFLLRVYTEAERTAIAQKGAQTAAGYFAAKEAVAKALGTGFRGFGMSDIGIATDDLGAPRAALTNGALERLVLMGGKGVFVSITHDKDTAAAIAVIES
ncbi:MAG: holo-ACP synthase [Clostridia bacterium]|nr:holo-ACP synthase [Clostridia bacterium]